MGWAEQRVMVREVVEGSSLVMMTQPTAVDLPYGLNSVPRPSATTPMVFAAATATATILSFTRSLIWGEGQSRGGERKVVRGGAGSDGGGRRLRLRDDGRVQRILRNGEKVY